MSAVVLLLLLNFGYIFGARKTIYEGAIMQLECPIGEKIYITSASYGRTLPGLHCQSTAAEGYVNDKCMMKSTCTIVAYNIFLGNPCRHVNKYLNVTYKCIQVRRVCEVIPMQISCSKGRRINILKVDFGTRIPKDYACPKGPSLLFKGLDCRSGDSSFFKYMCDFKKECEILPHSYAGWSKCYAKSKYLEVMFSCEDENEDETF